MKRTISQNKRIYGLLGKRRLGRSEKALLVRQFTNGRTSSSSEMTFKEAQRMIEHLDAGASQLPKEDPADKMRKKVLHYFHNMGWQTEKGKIDWQSVSGWMESKSYLNKGLNDYTLEELPKLVSQVQSMHNKHINELK